MSYRILLLACLVQLLFSTANARCEVKEVGFYHDQSGSVNVDEVGNFFEAKETDAGRLALNIGYSSGKVWIGSLSSLESQLEENLTCWATMINAHLDEIIGVRPAFDV